MKNEKLNTKKASKNQPQYTGNGIAIWKNTDKKGNIYLSIKIVGHNTIYAFKNK